MTSRETDGASSRRDVVVDALVAVGLYAVLAATFVIQVPEPVAAVVHVRGMGWGALLTLPLAIRRRVPLTVLGLVTTGAIGYQTVQPLSLVIPMAALALALYTAGVRGTSVARDVVRAASAVGLVATLGWIHVTTDIPAPVWPPRLALVAVLFTAAWVLGDQVRRGRARERELARLTAELRAEREKSERQAATEERLRIARELHDVLAHHVSVIGVQAAAARRVLDRDRDRARTALAAIEGSSREAVTELQRVLKLLRDGAVDGRPRRLAQLDEIIAEVRNVGLDVSAQVDALPTLPDSVDVTATRTVQEALTNVLRHAGAGTSVSVHVHVRNDELRITVVDDGRGVDTNERTPTDAGTGYGLIGLRERVEMHGGRLDAGPTGSGGFQVVAAMPVALGSDADGEPSGDDRTP